ncbi:MAG: gephyrin-like molybdotransferase Glp [Planctomycetota bacterium]
MSELQTLSEVQAEILSRIEPLPSVTIPLADAAGRTLAADIDARDDIPPFDNTAMDGFALRSDDTTHAASQSVELVVDGQVEAGADTLPNVGAGHAVRIYTGAPMPPGADAVVPWEKTEKFDDQSVTLDAPVRAGACIRRRGEDVTRGTVLLTPGTQLGPGAIGLLATVGRSTVEVGRRPRVAVHSSGNELVPVDAELTPGKIRNSNLYSIAARLTEWGADVLPRPVLLDTPEDVRAGLTATLELQPDAIVTTGGVSAGDLDFIKVVAAELGDEVAVRKVNMKPGKPLVDGTIGGVPFFGLPGNPAACLVSFEMFVRPVLARLEGRTDGAPPRRRGRLAHDATFPRIPRVQFLRAIAEYDETEESYRVTVPQAQGSHQMSSFAHANALLEWGIANEQTPEHIPAGTSVTVHLL